MLAGAYAQGRYSEDISFIGALAMSLGMNIQFEETRLSITRIAIICIGGYFAGKQMKKTTQD